MWVNMSRFSGSMHLADALFSSLRICFLHSISFGTSRTQGSINFEKECVVNGLWKCGQVIQSTILLNSGKSAHDLHDFCWLRSAMPQLPPYFRRHHKLGNGQAGIGQQSW